MDYSVKELAALAQALLSRSDSFEPHVPGGEKTPLEALEELGTLGELTAQSLTPSAAPAPVAPALPQKAASTSEAAAPSAAPSAKPDYRSLKIPSRYEGKNLQDDSLLKALVDFHKIHAPVLGVKSGQPKATEANAPAEEARAAPRSLGFAPAEIPIIDALPKNDSNMKRSTRPTAPVLRSKRHDG